MQDNRFLSLIYTFFLGVLFALFVGVGIQAFYPPPEAPRYPVDLNTYGKEPTTAQTVLLQQYDRKNQQYQAALKPYNRNVSVATLGIAVLLLAASLFLQQRFKLVSNGVMFGGFCTLIYSIGRGLASANSRYMFAAVSVGLVVVLIVGYYRFGRKSYG